MAKEISRIIQEYQKYAQKQGFKLNPNQKIRERIIKGLLEREKKFGQRYCPCRKITGNKKEDEKIICPCSFHLQEIKEKGHCLCFLFLK
jgi:ferredoxin-thioredoxin reductase catalytic subunit